MSPERTSVPTNQLFLCGPSARVAVARCPQIAEDRVFPERGQSGETADRLGPDHMVQ